MRASTLRVLLAILGAVVGSVPAQTPPTQAPAVAFTDVPARGVTGFARCQVQDVDRAQYGVAFFLDAFGSWWTKPNVDAPVSAIGADGSAAFLMATWNGADTYAERIAAFVVPLSYGERIPTVSGSSPIPAEIYSNALA